MDNSSYLTRGMPYIRNFFSRQSFEKRADFMFSFHADLAGAILLLISFVTVLSCSGASDIPSKSGSILVAISASLITITILVNAHICKSHIFDTSTEGIKILDDLTYKEHAGIWMPLSETGNVRKDLRRICLEARTLLIRYNIRIIVLWCIFILSMLLFTSFSIPIENGLLLFWIFTLLYILYTFAVVGLMYYHERTVCHYLTQIYTATDSIQANTVPVPEEIIAL